MAVRKHGRTGVNRANAAGAVRTGNQLYVYGNTARQLDVREEIRKKPKRSALMRPGKTEKKRCL